MAGQAPSRRELLQALTLAGLASTFSGFSRWSYALGEEVDPHHHQEAPVQIAHAAYTSQFFSPTEYRTVEVLADLILPATEDSSHQPQPGAKDAGVAEFIDFMVYSDPSLQPQFRNGLTWLGNASKPAASFAALSAEQQNALLERLAYKAKYRESEKAGQQFFLLFRKYTVMGFYTSRIGLESLDYPGLRLYSESPGCTHEGNPEHIGL
jgi:gluconate 2-dehydrogenase gamma chain